jgi:hypothetical protein
MTRILVTPQDLLEAEELGKIRNANKRKLGVQDHLIDKTKDSKDVDVMGALAEVVLARMLGGYVDKTVYPAGDKGWDIVVDGIKIDVKFSFNPDSCLILGDSTTFVPRADCYALVVGNDVQMEAIGFVRTSDLPKLMVVRKLKYTISKVVDQDRLIRFG